MIEVSKFLARVEKDRSGCWLWREHKSTTGYGRIRVGKKMKKAHRVSYELFVGRIPEGAWVLHSCHNPQCVNPKHLKTGSPADNTRDMMEAGRCCAGERHPHSKLTVQQVREIRRLLESGSLSQREIARRFSVHEVTVHDIKTGRTWSAKGCH